MGQEIYCDYCADFRGLPCLVNDVREEALRTFQPFTTDSFTILCGNCGCTVLRLNCHGEMHCEDCSGYQQPSYEELHGPLPSDEDNCGYLVGDVTCSRCASILAVVREREPAAATASFVA
jgi:hypothetical protein